MTARFEDIDAYISSFPEPQQQMLKDLRRIVKSEAPQATEAIAYQMPTFKLHGNLVHFAAYKNHIGFYPAPVMNPAFSERLAGYKTTKGAVQFPLNKPLPETLIRDMIKFRMAENLVKNNLSTLK